MISSIASLYLIKVPEEIAPEPYSAHGLIFTDLFCDGG